MALKIILILGIFTTTKVLSSSNAPQLPMDIAANFGGLTQFGSKNESGRTLISSFTLPCNRYVWLFPGLSVNFHSNPTYARRCRWGFIATPGAYIDITCSVFAIRPSFNGLNICPDPLGDNFYVSSPTATGFWGTRSFCRNSGPQAYRAKYYAGVKFWPSLFKIFLVSKVLPKFYCTAMIVPPTTPSPTTTVAPTTTSSTTTTSTTTPTTTSTSTTTTTTSSTTTTTTTTSSTTSTTTTTRTTTSSTTTPKTCKCGRKGPSSKPRIVGGITATPNEFPFQGGLVLKSDRSQVFCSVVVISSHHVITAAHCASNPNTAPQSEVVLGEHDTSTENDIAIYRNISQIAIHPNFDPVTLDNDIAILYLSSPVDLFNSEVINPICLPNATDPYVNVTASVAGWGLLSDAGKQPQLLQVVNVTTISNSYCDTLYPNRNITDNMICAAAPGRDACQGDSGGALFVENDYYELIGIVSFGIFCAHPQFPGVYGRAGNYIAWINSHIGDAENCA